MLFFLSTLPSPALIAEILASRTSEVEETYFPVIYTLAVEFSHYFFLFPSPQIFLDGMLSSFT